MKLGVLSLGLVLALSSVAGCNAALNVQQLVNSQIVSQSIEVNQENSASSNQPSSPSVKASVSPNAPGTPESSTGDAVVSSDSINGDIPFELDRVRFIEAQASYGSILIVDKDSYYTPKGFIVDGIVQRGEGACVLPQLRSKDGQNYRNIRFSMITEKTSEYWRFNANEWPSGSIDGIDIGPSGTSWCFTDYNLSPAGGSNGGCKPYTDGKKYTYLEVDSSCPVGELIPFRLTLEGYAGKVISFKFALKISGG